MDETPVPGENLLRAICCARLETSLASNGCQGAAMR